MLLVAQHCSTVNKLFRFTNSNNFYFNRAGFTCAVLDCPEWLGVPVEPGCYRRYEVNKCCSFWGKLSYVPIPTTSEDKPIEECDVEGKKYRKEKSSSLRTLA
ncbi:hypothetical protein NQ317_004222 [Molorchus minor]|uniref:Uncharacterized protein n=1 Tax=Molorchus minor TaxID=1323400 RepID=A0ABQ9JKF4_9CUCU|nr:hypothetical protein NQ317_004222 [Molorchus minor]